MGYTTDFFGEFTLDRELKPEHAAYLRKFNETRRMKRDAAKSELRPDPLRIAAGLPIGVQGEFFVGAGGSRGQEKGASAGDILDYNSPPSTQPSLWCQWTVSDNGMEIVWDQGEKFSDYVPWIEYLIDNFLKPWGYSLNGDVKWNGEDTYDLGLIEIRDNVMTVKRGVIEYR
jgi:hypothetical protein